MGREPLRRGYQTGGGGGDVPAFTAFSIDGQDNPLEVGESSLVNPTFLWVTTHAAMIVPDSLQIDDITGGVNIGSGLPDVSSYAATYPAITNLVAATNRFRIRGQNTLFDHFDRDYDLDWDWRLYYGEGAAGPLDEVMVKALRVSALAAAFAGDYVFLAGDYKYICYPAAYGLAVNFTDPATGFGVPMDAMYVVNVTNAFGQTTPYNVHRTWNILGSAVTIRVS